MPVQRCIGIQKILGELPWRKLIGRCLCEEEQRSWEEAPIIQQYNAFGCLITCFVRKKVLGWHKGLE